MINSSEWVTGNINIQHFILLNSNNCLDNYFYFSLKKSPVFTSPKHTLSAIHELR